MANRLTEIPKYNVLVLEAGLSCVSFSCLFASYFTYLFLPRNEGVLPAIVPFLGNSLPNSLYDWNYSTTAQTGLNGRAIPYPRYTIPLLSKLIELR